MALSLSRWSGKVALVTGASVGIGAAIVEKLVEQGLQVVGVARRKELIEQQAQTLKSHPGKLFAQKADMTKESDILSAIKWTTDNVGPISILINNAGVLISGSLLESKTDVWQQAFDINVMGLCIATREVVKNMRENNTNGHIVHISSIVAHTVTGEIPDANVYPATKHAVKALSEVLRLELKDSGLKIKVSCVSPGVVNTDIAADSKRKYESVDKTFQNGISPVDVAQAVVYALSTPPNVQIQDIIIRPV